MKIFNKITSSGCKITPVSHSLTLPDETVMPYRLFTISLTKIQTVTFEKIAVTFENKAHTLSSLRRIQRFMVDYILDANIIARLIFALLPHKLPYRLALDRTNWKFGDKNINIRVLAIVYRGVAFPVLFTLLNKQGNSSTDERIALMERYIHLVCLQTYEWLPENVNFFTFRLLSEQP